MVTRGSLRIAALVTSLLAGLSSGVLVSPSTAHAAGSGPLRILLEGDSLTQGFNGDFTWRYRFDKELVRQGVSANLVGTRRSPYVRSGFSSSQYADPHFDSDHFAQVSSTLLWHVARVRQEVTTDQPDVVVLAAGVNDLRNGVSPAGTDATLRRWIAQARAAKPDLRIIVSPVLDATDVNRPWLPDRIRQFRALEATTVSDLSTAQSPITLAKTAQGWSVPAFTYDNLHPTPTGETLIAQRIAEEFHRLGYLPQAPHVFRTTPWNRVARVAGRSAGRRVVLTWDQESLSGVRIWMRRVGGKARILRGVHGHGEFVTPRLARGARYQFRISMVRDKIFTPYGPITTVKVLNGGAPLPVSRVTITSTGIRWARAARATKYVVSYQRSSSAEWTTRTTKALSLRVSGVVAAQVQAVNRHGRSAARSASR